MMRYKQLCVGKMVVLLSVVVGMMTPSVWANLVPYTLGDTTIMVDSSVLGYNSPLLAHLRNGMPLRRGSEASVEDQGEDEAAVSDHSRENTLEFHRSESQDAADSYELKEQFTSETDFMTTPDGMLNINVLKQTQSLTPGRYNSPLADRPTPITIDEAAGIYLKQHGLPLRPQANTSPLYYAVETPDFSQVSQKIHNIVTSLNPKLNDRGPSPAGVSPMLSFSGQQPARPGDTPPTFTNTDGFTGVSVQHMVPEDPGVYDASTTNGVDVSTMVSSDPGTTHPLLFSDLPGRPFTPADSDPVQVSQIPLDEHGQVVDMTHTHKSVTGTTEIQNTVADTADIQEPIIYTTEIQEPVTDTTVKQEPVTDITVKQEPQTDTTNKQEPQPDTTNKQEPLTDTTNKQEPQTDTTNKQEPQPDTTNKQEPLTDTTNKQEPLTDTPNKQEPQTDTTNKQETQTDTTNKQEPQTDATNKQEPKPDTTNKQETQTDTTNKQETQTDTTNKQETQTDITNKQEIQTDTTNKQETQTDITNKQDLPSLGKATLPLLYIVNTQEPVTDETNTQESQTDAANTQDLVTETSANNGHLVDAEDPLIDIRQTDTEGVVTPGQEKQLGSSTDQTADQAETTTPETDQVTLEIYEGGETTIPPPTPQPDVDLQEILLQKVVELQQTEAEESKRGVIEKKDQEALDLAMADLLENVFDPVTDPPTTTQDPLTTSAGDEPVLNGGSEASQTDSVLDGGGGGDAVVTSKGEAESTTLPPSDAPLRTDEDEGAGLDLGPDSELSVQSSSVAEGDILGGGESESSAVSYNPFDLTLLADFPPTRGEPEIDDSPIHYFPGLPHPPPIMLGEAAGVYIGDERHTHGENKYATRSDPPRPDDDDLNTWYDKDPISIFDPLHNPKPDSHFPAPVDHAEEGNEHIPGPHDHPGQNEDYLPGPLNHSGEESDHFPGPLDHRDDESDAAPGNGDSVGDDEDERRVDSFSDGNDDEEDKLASTEDGGGVASMRLPGLTKHRPDVLDPADNNVEVQIPPSHQIPGHVPPSPPSVHHDYVGVDETKKTATAFPGAVLHSAQPELFTMAACRCGLRFSQKIVGGQATDVDQFPWMVGIANKYDNFVFCGGSIINDIYILSAAHCLHGKQPRDIVVRVGETVRGSHLAITMDVQNIIIHGKFNSIEVTRNDIGLLKLSKPLVYNARVFPVCLAADGDFANEKAVVSGWGRNKFGGNLLQGLQEATVSVQSTADCRKSSLYQKKEIHRKILCARGPGKDACQGDSGGPLVFLNGDHYIQIGIVSWGIGCAQINYPGIYTNVSSFRKWITKKTTDGNSCRGGLFKKRQPKNKMRKKNKPGNVRDGEEEGEGNQGGRKPGLDLTPWLPLFTQGAAANDTGENNSGGNKKPGKNNKRKNDQQEEGNDEDEIISDDNDRPNNSNNNKNSNNNNNNNNNKRKTNNRNDESNTNNRRKNNKNKNRGTEDDNDQGDSSAEKHNTNKNNNNKGGGNRRKNNKKGSGGSTEDLEGESNWSNIQEALEGIAQVISEEASSLN